MQGKLPTLLEMKLNHEIVWSWNQKINLSQHQVIKIKLSRGFKVKWFCVIIFMWQKTMTKSYVQLSLVTSKLILAKVIHVCNFIKDVLYHGGSTCKFVNFSQFLENLWAGSGYWAFELCAFIIMLTVCFQFFIFRTLKT